MAVLPYKQQEGTKKEQVAKMFNNISAKYDLLNRVLSMGIDIQWRNTAVNILKKHQPKIILDVATGTGDFAIAALKAKPTQIIGIDISEQMLAVGKQKIKDKKLDHIIQLQKGDSENIDFPDNNFDAVIVSFGVRNFENLENGLSEIYRVLKPGGIAIVLEFSQPTKFPIKQLYKFYSKNILPRIGKTISKDSAAYTYLPESVDAFPFGKNFTAILDKIGYQKTTCKELTFGISSIYTGIK